MVFFGLILLMAVITIMGKVFMAKDKKAAAAVEAALKEIRPDAVVHCAAWTAVDAAEDEENQPKGEFVLVIRGAEPVEEQEATLDDGLARVEQLRSEGASLKDAVKQAARELEAQYDLNIMEKQQTLSTITSKCLLGMDEVLERAAPDLVLVHGDTTTTFAGALSAFYHKIPVGHVEAGLRSWDKYFLYVIIILCPQW
mgnify:CR=1 FL=1